MLYGGKYYEKTRSFLALTLSIIFIFSFSLNAFATNEDIPLDENGNFSFFINESENLSDMVKISEETVYVDDGSGNMVPVTVTRYRSAEDVKLYGTATSSFGARDLNPVVPVGTRDTLVITITNDQINNFGCSYRYG